MYICANQKVLYQKDKNTLFVNLTRAYMDSNSLEEGLEKLGFTAGEANATVFFKFGECFIKIASWYVDDGLLVTDSTESMERMVEEMGRSFDIQDLGGLERLLGIKITCNQNAGTIHLSQLAFINTIAKPFSVSFGKLTKSPIDTTIHFQKTATDDTGIDIPYTSLIGSINYCAITP